MAEALAVVGVVASIVQLVDFGTRVLSRLEEYQSRAHDLPEAFRHIKAELPVLLDALRQTRSAINSGSIQGESQRALVPALNGCEVQIRLLDDVIGKVLFTPNDSWARRGRKALRSLRYDSKVEKIATVVRGYIQTLTYHATTSLRPLADRTRARTSPIFTVPFRRDPQFVERKALAELHSKTQPSSRVALVGLGGVGKSQLAVEYAYRVREKSPTTSVFWVHASNKARFEQGYRTIAERAKLPGWDTLGEDILKLVYNWLCDESNGRWVLIIDNADDLDVFTSRPKDDVSLLDLLPQSPNGSVVITSRRRDAAFGLTGSYTDIVTINPMDRADALTLLQNKLGKSYEQNDAAELAEILDYMPLALSQAAAYISQRTPRMTLSTYLQDLRKGDQDRAKLLQRDVGDSRRDRTASNSIISTWQISFNYIRKSRPSATQLLSLMCLFDRQGIPEHLLNGNYQQTGVADFEEDLNTLMDFSLVATEVDGHHFEMHRLVQFSTRAWLELQGDLESWKERYVTLMNNQFPYGDFHNWKICQPLFPHAQAAVTCRPVNHGPLRLWSALLYKAAWYADDRGKYQIACEMARLSLEADEIVLGLEDPSTLSSADLLGLILSHLKEFKEAEEMHRRALEGREKVLGPEHPDTLLCMSNLGIVFEKLGKYEEAESMHRRALEAREKFAKPDDLGILQPILNLAVAVWMQGRYKEAEKLEVRVLDTRKRLLGDEHPDTLRAMNNLAFTLKSQGRDEEAIALMEVCAKGRRDILGSAHNDTEDSCTALSDWKTEVEEKSNKKRKQLFRKQ